VSEIGQLALVDFFEESGVFSMRISDEGIGQSIKNEASRRTIPVHPHLIELGLKDRVERLRATGETQLFPRAKAGSVNGMGNWLSKSFGDHLARHGIQSPVGIVGFHSLRKTVIQALKDCGVREEARKEYVGHELEGEHHVRYGKLFSPAQLLNGVPKGALETAGIRELTYELDLDAVRSALAAPPPERRQRQRS
jgi:integrase